MGWSQPPKCLLAESIITSFSNELNLWDFQSLSEISIKMTQKYYSFSLISLDAQFIRSSLKPFVNESARLSFDDTKLIEIIQFESNYLTMLYLRWMCLNLPLCIKFCTLDIAAWLSQWIYMAGTGLGHRGISFKNYQWYSTSSPALSKAINSDFIVERVIHVCLKDFQDTNVPPRVNTYPLVDFDSSESVIHFASLYPSSIDGYFLYLMHILWY